MKGELNMANYIVSSGITSTGISLNRDSMTILDGGTVNSTTANFRGYLYVHSGGAANSTTVKYDGRINVYSGGTANNTMVSSGGNMTIDTGGTANGTTVSSGGSMTIATGGTANSTTVNYSASINVYSGGTATNIVWTPCVGNLGIAEGAVVTFASQYSGVYYGSNNQLLSKATTMDGKEINQYGTAYVMSGGTANSTTINGLGILCVYSGGTANSTTVNRGWLTIDTGGTANSTTNNCGVFVNSGGTANNTTVNDNGSLDVSSGGTVNGITVSSGGSIYVSSGGKLTGRMSFNYGDTVENEVGAILDFDLTQTTAGAAALVNGLSRVSGTPIYTLTVSGTESSGTYSLADDISVFNSIISVMTTSGEQLGSLMVGQKLETEYADYTLKNTQGSLTVTVKASGTVPPSGDTTPPSDPTGLRAFVDGQDVALVWSVSTDDNSGVKEYIVKYSLDGEVFTARTGGTSYVLSNADYGSYSWSVQAVDAAGNESAVTTGDAFTVSDFNPYIVEYSPDSFEHVLRFKVSSEALDSFRLPTGTYQARSRSVSSEEWTAVESPLVSMVDASPQLVKSDADSNADVFFANPVGTWEAGYVAQHVGSVNDWTGTNEYAGILGKNKFADIFEGSTDANILLMTDDANGDGLFVDDIYSALPGSVSEQQSRIAQIDEIRAGFGNDIVDMTSQRFEYIGDGLTIRGGEGNDVIWANKGENMLFGDAGNDRIVGASGNDVIAGGIGNDRMHGGGGNDVFTFCENWGTDTVEQLAGGSVTLWFASGSEANWNAGTLTYMDGENSVKVSGVSADKITLKFGEDGSDQFSSLSGMGAFFDATTERIFEESSKGILASL